MSDMERLTIDVYIASAKNIAKEQRYYANFEKGMMHNVCITNAENNEQLAEWLEELQRYRDLAEQGRLIVLPCKVGTELFLSSNPNMHCRLKEYKFLGNEVAIVIDCWEWQRTCTRMLSDFGKTVFLTQAEAEAKLKELEGGAE